MFRDKVLKTNRKSLCYKKWTWISFSVWLMFMFVLGAHKWEGLRGVVVDKPQYPNWRWSVGISSWHVHMKTKLFIAVFLRPRMYMLQTAIYAKHVIRPESCLNQFHLRYLFRCLIPYKWTTYYRLKLGGHPYYLMISSSKCHSTPYFYPRWQASATKNLRERLMFMTLPLWKMKVLNVLVLCALS